MSESGLHRVGCRRVATRAREPRRTRWALAVITLTGASVLAAPSIAHGAARGWTDAGLHVVGGPVVADQLVLVNNVNAHHQLELSGINPATGATVWSAPFAQSTITGGVGFAPISVGSIVLDFAPDGTEANPLTYVEGLDVTTGAPLWHFTTPVQVIDAPLVCGAGKYFCFTYYSSQSSTSLIELNPKTGRPVNEVKGLARAMGVAIAGHPDTSDLWQSDATAPTFEQTSTNGKVQWTRSVSALFGGSQFDPDYGWNFNVVGTLDIGSVGDTPHGSAGHLSENLNPLKTIGVTTTTGNVKWSAKGAYQCMGSLAFLTSNVLCDYQGIARQVGTSESFKGVALTLRGFNSGSGALTWSEPVLDVQSLSVGTNISFVDSTHVLVENDVKKWVVLNTDDGATSPAISAASYWCEVISTYSILAVTGVANSSSRVAMPVFHGCNAEGISMSTVPSTTPTNVGVNVAGDFIWASPQGLNAVAAK